jgi:hypothetical protein
MLNLVKRRTIDLLIEQFWKQGYLTVSRKYGTYLPEPSRIGSFDVDIVARQRNNYAIGITLSRDDIYDKNIMEKINFLATRQTKYTNKRVLLFIGVPAEFSKELREILSAIDPEVRKNIRSFQISERKIPARRKRPQNMVLFS